MKKLVVVLVLLIVGLVWGCDEDILGAPEIFTVSFDGNGATGGKMAPMAVEKYSTIKLSKNIFEKINATWMSWNTQADGSGYDFADKSEISIVENVVLYAVWHEWEKLPVAEISIVDELIDFTSAISLSSQEKDAKIYYTLDSSIPSEKSNLYTSPFTLADEQSPCQLKVIVIKEGYIDSEVTSHDYTMAELAKPIISHIGSNLIINLAKVTLASENPNARLYYTTDNSHPTLESSLYTEPFALDFLGEKTLKIVAIKEGLVDSPIVSTTLVGIVESTTMNYVEGSSFSMGDQTEAAPVHEVKIDTFYMGAYEVTQKEFAEIFGEEAVRTNYNSVESDTSHPANYVNWYEAIAYCNKLSTKMGLEAVYSVKNVDFDALVHGDIPTVSNEDWDTATCDWSKNGYRLPTEAEWEYAAKGGIHKKSFDYSGDTDHERVGWTSINSRTKVHPVGELLKNSLYLYDMTGNVEEWCWDWLGPYGTTPEENPTGSLSGRTRVTRGGSYESTWTNCKVITRLYEEPYRGYTEHGFRLVRRAN